MPTCEVRMTSMRAGKLRWIPCGEPATERVDWPGYSGSIHRCASCAGVKPESWGGVRPVVVRL